MKRRNFLKIFPAASVTPFVVNGFPLRPFANSKMAKILDTCEGVEERVLVLIQLKGGNDGVNAVIPINQYDKYAAVRPTVRIPQDKLINLDTTLPNADQVGLNPALASFKAMYDKGNAALVQGVGYQSMNQSHFKATDLWLSGGDSTPDGNNLGTGWIGRSLQAFYPDVLGAPTAQMPDPLGIQIGDSNPSLGFHTETEHQNAINLTGQDAAGFFSLIQTIGGAPMKNIPNSDLGGEVKYVISVEQSVNLYAQRITQVFNAGSNSIATYPSGNDYGMNGATLADQLKTIARLVRGGSKTKIYLCQLGGFDTHNAQVDSGDTTVGDHANLLRYLSDSVKTFFDDLEGLGIADQVVSCTFSEFGRCAEENGSFGTDHGTLAPLMVFGKNIQAGVKGTNVNLSNLTNDGQLQGMQYDYRQVFTTLLQDWLGADNEILEQTMFDGYAKMPLVDAAAVVNPDCYFGTTTAANDPYQQVRALKIYPNPASVTAEVSFDSERSFSARLTLHSLGGSLITAMNVQVAPGTNFYYLDVLGLPPAPYFVRLEDKASGRAEVVKLTVVR